MSKTIDIILTETEPGLGRAGDLKKVKLGHYRNRLAPQGLALPNNKANLNRFEAIKKREEKRLTEIKAEATRIQKLLDGKVITFTEKAQESGKLYGSVTRDKVSAAIQEQFNVPIESKYFLFSPIKEVGDLAVKVELHPDHVFTFKVSVIGETSAQSSYQEEDEDEEEEQEDEAEETTEADDTEE
jgi:large subunit ribosomal protein L9